MGWSKKKSSLITQSCNRRFFCLVHSDLRIPVLAHFDKKVKEKISVLAWLPKCRFLFHQGLSIETGICTMEGTLPQVPYPSVPLILLDPNGSLPINTLWSQTKTLTLHFLKGKTLSYPWVSYPCLPFIIVCPERDPDVLGVRAGLSWLCRPQGAPGQDPEGSWEGRAGRSWLH